MAVETLATARDLRVFLDLDPDDDVAIPTARAELLLEGVAKSVLAYCNRETFLVQESTVRVDGLGSFELVLPWAPVVDVTSVVEDPAGLWALETLVPASADWVQRVEWSEAGILRRIDGGRFARRFRFYEVTFEHGYPDIPPDVRNNVCRVAARAVSNPEGLATEGVTGYNAGFAFDETRLPVLTRPDRRELDPYRL